MSDSVPLIGTANVHFIRPYVLPDFIENLGNLKEPFKFLSKVESYRDYYTKFEKGASGSGGGRPCFVPKMGELLPLLRRHTFDSFWKTFRIKARREAEYYYLMPLSVSLEKVAREKELGHHSYAYLFPFGVVCVNQELTYTGPAFSFEEMIERTNRERNMFMQWANPVARSINTCLFEPSSLDVDPFYTHSLIFLDETDPSLVFGDLHHAKAIAGLVKSKTDFEYWTKEKVYNDILSCKLPELSDGEILIFDCGTTFLYPVKRDGQFKKSTFKCMRRNFSAFLNFIFAVNRFLEACKSRQKQLSKNHLGEIRKAFQTVFVRSDSDYALEYYRRFSKLIVAKIGLNVRLGEMEAE